MVAAYARKREPSTKDAKGVAVARERARLELRDPSRRNQDNRRIRRGEEEVEEEL